MKLILLDNIVEFPNNKESLNNIFDKINEVLKKYCYLLSHFIVDGIEIYNDYEEFLSENIEFIQEIKVEVRTQAEFIEEILQSTKEYLKRALPSIRRLGEEFYQTSKETSWQSLTELFEAIQWLMQSYYTIDQNNSLNEIIPSYEIWNEYAQQILKLNQIIPDLQQAVENQDMILIGDMLTYEVAPIFERMLEKMQDMMPEAVSDSHVN